MYIHLCVCSNARMRPSSVATQASRKSHHHHGVLVTILLLFVMSLNFCDQRVRLRAIRWRLAAHRFDVLGELKSGQHYAYLRYGASDRTVDRSIEWTNERMNEPSASRPNGTFLIVMRQFGLNVADECLYAAVLLLCCWTLYCWAVVPLMRFHVGLFLLSACWFYAIFCQIHWIAFSNRKTKKSQRAATHHDSSQPRTSQTKQNERSQLPAHSSLFAVRSSIKVLCLDVAAVRPAKRLVIIFSNASSRSGVFRFGVWPIPRNAGHNGRWLRTTYNNMDHKHGAVDNRWFCLFLTFGLFQFVFLLRYCSQLWIEAIKLCMYVCMYVRTTLLGNCESSQSNCTYLHTIRACLCVCVFV